MNRIFSNIRTRLFTPIYLLFTIRWALLLGVALRFYVNSYNLIYSVTTIPIVLSLIILNFVFGLYLTQRSIKYGRRWTEILVLFDIVTIFIFNFLTDDPATDLFLLYFLPLITATSYLSIVGFVSTLLVISILFVLNVFITSYWMPFSEEFISILVPRLALLALVSFVSALTSIQLRERNKLLEKLTQELEAVNVSTVNILRQENLSARLQRIVTASANLLDASFAEVSLFDQDKQVIEVVSTSAGIKGSVIKPGYRYPFHSGIASVVIRTNMSYIVNNYAESIYRIEELKSLFSSSISVPLILNDAVVGVISVFSTSEKGQKFVQEDLLVLERLAEQASLAIYDMQLLERERDLLAIQENIRRISIEISKSQALSQVATTILEGLRQLVPFDRASFQLFDGDNRRLLATIGISSPSVELLRPLSEDSLIQEIIAHKEIAILSDPHTHSHWDELDETQDVGSWIGIPLIYNNNPIGLITLDHSDPNFYKPSIRNVLELFVGQATIAVENARLITVLEKQIERLQQSESLAMIGLIYGEDIHISSNRLGAARAFATYIKENSSDPTIIHKAKRIESNIEEFLERIRTFQGIVQSAGPQPIDLHEVLQEAIDSINISHMIEIHWEKPERFSREIIGFERQLKQVFRVILFNAVEAMNGEGILTLDIRESLQDNRAFVEVLISDTGSGIPKKLQPHIFSVGSQDNNKPKKGFGFGLAWARLFMRWYGGDITFQTALGVGTTMKVTMPQEMQLH